MFNVSSSTLSSLAFILFALLAAQLLLGCPPEETLSNDEAREALDEAMLSTQAEALTYDTIEITTDFTIGAAVEDAVEEMKAFVESQLPCAQTNREGATLTIVYGATGDTCLYNGKSYSGTHQVTLSKNDDTSIEVAHTWTDMSDGKLMLDGVATVTWNRDTQTRNVVHDLTWNDGTRSVQGSGDRTQSLLDSEMGLRGGIQISGIRTWSTAKGDWNLTLEDVEIRAQDPIPQKGSYALTHPNGKVLGLSFERLDENTIEVSMTGTRRDRTFQVSRIGTVVDTTNR
ncbi:MAG: hypothetical protein AAFX99_23985 [Myxococcota bacterium]